MSLRAVALIAVLAVLLGGRAPDAQGPPAGPPMPFEDVGACPFEGCIYREWVANAEVSVLRDRRPDAEVAYTLTAGDRVRAITGIVTTTKPGRVQFREAVDLWTTEGPLHVEPGETLYPLTYQGEGNWTAWFDGRLYDEVDGSDFHNGVCDTRPERCRGTILERPESTWWIRLDRRGVRGWTREPEKFDNKDALG